MRNLKMRKVSKGIIDIKISDKTIRNILNKFYGVMRENGIKEGEWIQNGRNVANPEWTACETLFLDTLMGKFHMALLLNNTPEDLKAYGERPQQVSYDEEEGE